MAISENLEIQNFFNKIQVDGNPEVVFFDRSPFDFEWETVNKKVRITSTEKYRLDRVADKHFGDPNAYWIIMLANDINDPFQISIGDVLVIPKPSEIFDFLGKFRREGI